MFPGINVTDQGYKYLGSYIGSEAGQAQYVNTLVNEWIEDVNALAKIAKTEPQCAYSAYVYGMSKRWAFICRSTPDVNQQLRRLGHHISLTLIPAIPGHGFEGNCYILLRITDVMYRCLKEDLIYFENCVYFTFLSVYWYGGR